MKTATYTGRNEKRGVMEYPVFDCDFTKIKMRNFGYNSFGPANGDDRIILNVDGAETLDMYYDKKNGKPMFNKFYGWIELNCTNGPMSIYVTPIDEKARLYRISA